MDYAYHVLVMMCLYAILATSFNIVVGMAGLFALSHAAFYAIGAYTTAILTVRLGLPFPIPLLIGAALTSAIGCAAAVPALRVGGHYLVVMTLALQVILIDVLRNMQDLTGGPDGLSGVPNLVLFGWRLSTPGRFLILAAVMAVLCVWIAWRTERSPFGRALRAVRENDLAAASVGKDVVAMKLKAFALSAGLAAVAGSLLAQYIGFVGPQSFTVDETIFILGMVILGGTGNTFGAALGAIVLVALPEALKFLALPPATADMMRNVLYGVVLILILRVRPLGLLPERHRAPEPAAADAAGPALGLAHGAAAVLLARGLHKRFGGIRAANGVDIELRPGSITGLIGPNGAGKTTAFNLLTGFLRPDAGHVSYRGREITGGSPHDLVAAGVARSFQDLRLFRGMSVLENVLVAMPNQTGDGLLANFLRPRAVAAEERRNAARARALLTYVGLRGDPGGSTDNLAYAEEKLLAIARLLATDAQVLLLDEPLSGLDPTTLDDILPIIRGLAEAGRAICVVEHNLDVIRGLCDTACYLDRGKVLATGEPEALMRDPHLVQSYLR